MLRFVIILILLPIAIFTEEFTSYAKSLQKKYEQDMERIEKEYRLKVKNTKVKYAKDLEKIKRQIMVKGDLKEAVRIDNEIQIINAELGTVKKKRPVKKVVRRNNSPVTIKYSGDIEISKFSAGAKLYLNRAVSITNIPRKLKGFKFTRTSINSGLPETIIGKKGNKIYIVVDHRYLHMISKSDGWVKDKEVVTVNGGLQGPTLYSKIFYKDGEVTLPYTGYFSVLVIAKSLKVIK